MTTTTNLPDGKSPDLHLAHPTPAEVLKIWHLIAEPWKDALTLEEFLEESTSLFTDPVPKDSPMTLWILVCKDSVPDDRSILASCETWKKRAWVSDKGGNVTDGVIHAVASVFCDPKYRGRGYAKRMMKELTVMLKTWRVDQHETVVGSVLYSDIGKEYYADLGWTAADNNTHIEFPALEGKWPISVKKLGEDDIARLCDVDEKLVKANMGRKSNRGRMVIVPDHEHMLWHHRKEEFVCPKLFGKSPQIKGASIGKDGRRIWAIWAHRYYKTPGVHSGNTLYILRLVFEDEDADVIELQAQLQLLIQAAQVEASDWNLNTVKIWDPSALTQKLLQGSSVQYIRKDRDTDGIASLLWYGDEGESWERPEWYLNEKYAWC